MHAQLQQLKHLLHTQMNNRLVEFHSHFLRSYNFELLCSCTKPRDSRQGVFLLKIFYIFLVHYSNSYDKSAQFGNCTFPTINYRSTSKRTTDFVSKSTHYCLKRQEVINFIYYNDTQVFMATGFCVYFSCVVFFLGQFYDNSALEWVGLTNSYPYRRQDMWEQDNTIQPVY